LGSFLPFGRTIPDRWNASIARSRLPSAAAFTILPKTRRARPVNREP